MNKPDTASPLWLLPILGILAFQMVLFRGFIPDDAFISFRVAEQLANGDGLVYNIGERVEGYSNLLWVLLLALFSRLGVDVIWAAKGLGVLFSELIFYPMPVSSHDFGKSDPAAPVRCFLADRRCWRNQMCENFRLEEPEK